jgi:aryl-alcohol dehydrogenase-like predicted oxidoreductase
MKLHWGLSKYIELSKSKNLPRMMSVQNPYNLVNRTYEAGLLAYSPLACGYLSGKYRNNQMPKGTRIERDGDFWSRYNKPNAGKAIDAYYEVAQKYELDLAQMSLKFLEIQPFVTSVIIGATTMEQLKTNIESVNVDLKNEIIKEINDVQTIYPNPCP